VAKDSRSLILLLGVALLVDVAIAQSVAALCGSVDSALYVAASSVLFCAGVDFALFVASAPSLWRYRCPKWQRAPDKSASTLPCTAIVVPTLLVSEQSIRRNVRAMEAHFLSHHASVRYFILLSDFVDSAVAETIADVCLLNIAAKEIALLNSSFCSSQTRIYVAHRPRTWSDSERCWMGYERKRGKINDLNDLIATGRTERFALISGDVEPLRAVRYVITLDEDNRLFPDGARKLIQRMIAAEETVEVDAQRNVVTRGHGLLQPLPIEAINPEEATYYQRMVVASGSLIDSLEAFYHASFDQGSFLGKGIYSVALFRSILGNRFPSSRVLSHDIIEGCFLRSALIPDVPVLEIPPPTIGADLSRTHRWIRGDWQVLAWAFPGPPSTGDERNPLSALSRWKVLDNVRRSLGPISSLSLLLIGPLLGLTSGALPVVLLIFRGVPAIATTLAIRHSRELRRAAETMPPDEPRSSIVANMLREMITFSCLPLGAWTSVSAIAIANWRMRVSRCLCLEWHSSAVTQGRESISLLSAYRGFWPNLAVALIILSALSLRLIRDRLYYSSLAIVWLLAPVTAYMLARLSTPASRLRYKPSGYG
jgi:cyclic beta-1,2-glucan synthetase